MEELFEDSRYTREYGQIPSRPRSLTPASCATSILVVLLSHSVPARHFLRFLVYQIVRDIWFLAILRHVSCFRRSREAAQFWSAAQQCPVAFGASRSLCLIGCTSFACNVTCMRIAVQLDKRYCPGRQDCITRRIRWHRDAQRYWTLSTCQRPSLMASR